jgi:hypothetical protein
LISSVVLEIYTWRKRNGISTNQFTDPNHYWADYSLSFSLDERVFASSALVVRLSKADVKHRSNVAEKNQSKIFTELGESLGFASSPHVSTHG